MKACVFTLGCKQNEVESESVMQGLAERGLEVSAELGYADFYFLNTCAVTAEAERKSRQAVARMRKFNPAAPVVVFGCAAQNSPESFAEKEGVRFVSGAMHKDAVLDFADRLLREGAVDCCRVSVEEERAFCELPAPKRVRTRACLRVQDGCNRFCTYCLIPYLRGRSRSRDAELVHREALASGARELVLTGIDLSSYRSGELDLGGLLLLLRDVPARIRLGSLEVSVVTDRFLEEMKVAGNVMPHFHLSLQSGSSRVLRAMNRHYTREEYLEACRKIYAAFPEAAVTTDIIVGFPGETEEEFEESLSILPAAGFAKVHAFPFSRRAGTQAAKLPDTPAAVKRERMARMLAACQRAEEEYLSHFLGARKIALFESDGGYTENYIRVYHESASEGGMYEVRLLERYRDGFKCELLSRVE